MPNEERLAELEKRIKVLKEKVIPPIDSLVHLVKSLRIETERAIKDFEDYIRADHVLYNKTWNDFMKEMEEEDKKKENEDNVSGKILKRDKRGIPGEIRG